MEKFILSKTIAQLRKKPLTYEENGEKHTIFASELPEEIRKKLFDFLSNWYRSRISSSPFRSTFSHLDFPAGFKWPSIANANLKTILNKLSLWEEPQALRQIKIVDVFAINGLGFKKKNHAFLDIESYLGDPTETNSNRTETSIRKLIMDCQQLLKIPYLNFIRSEDLRYGIYIIKMGVNFDEFIELLTLERYVDTIRQRAQFK
jgi:hypothetical protein